MKKLLTKKEWCIYYYLLEKSQYGQWTKRKEVLINVFGVHDKEELSNLYYSKRARELTKAVRKINESDEVDKLIISNSRLGLKIATEQEAEEYLKRELQEILSKFKRYHRKIKKIGLDRQLDIEGNVKKAFIQGEKENEKY